MPDLLLELRSEEIPARMQRKAAAELKKRVTDALVDGGLTYEGCQEYWTPRRLTLDVRGVDAQSKPVREERKGPRSDAPEQAIQGFLKSAGLASVDEAELRSDPKKGDFYVAVTERPGRAAEDIIAEAMPGLVKSFPWPKSMRWGAASAMPGSLRWVRPLQSVLCTFGPETEDPVTIAFEIDGTAASNTTVGHRFHAPDAFAVRRFGDYAEKLDKAKVMLDAERRKQTILADARNLAFANGLDLVEDEALLEEVAGLVEWPVVLLGEFDAEFLAIPDEVIRLTIKTNQKCFVTREQGSDRLTNRFILVSNIEARDGGAEIAHGNGKVVRARLADALYFWKTDQADLPDLDTLGTSAEKLGLDLKKTLDQRMARLDALDVTFHARLGTQGQRVGRIATLAQELARVVGADPSLVRRAALLAKADLQSEVVGEFPELQGVIGRKYAGLQGEHDAVAVAVEDHYKPQGPSDAVPADPVAIAVALADKLDTLSGFWAIEEKPTGSKDPYALRRAALGVIRIVLENEVRLGLWPSITHAEQAYTDKSFDSAPVVSTEDVRPARNVDLLAFFHDRLKVYLRDQGARHDLIDAVISDDADDLLMIVRRVEALGAFLDGEDGANLLAGTKRAANILSAEEKKGTAVADSVDPVLFGEPTERALHDAVNQAENAAAQAIQKEDFSAAMAALSVLREPVDSFFEDVLVNVEDEAVRANRLALLARIRAATAPVADFSKIAG